MPTKRPNHVLRALMSEYGFTEESLAETVNTQAEKLSGTYGKATDRHVRRWLSGEVSWPWPCYLQPLEKIFGLSAVELGFLPRSRVSAGPLCPPSRLQEPASEQEGSPVRRREFFLAATGTVVHVAVMPLPTAGRIGLSDVQKIHTAISDLHTLDDQHGGGDLADVAENYIAHVQAAMRRCVYGNNAERAIYTALGELSASAGWFAFDAGQQERARGHFDAGLRAALLAGNRGLQARIWSHMARQAWELGHGSEAVAIARAALTATRPTRNPRLSALLHARTAMGHALLGQSGSCERSLAHAERTFEQVDDQPVPAWLAFCGPEELAILAAMSRYQLGNHVQAEGSAAQALALSSSQFQRNQFAYTVHLGNCQLAQGKVEEAADTAMSALQKLSAVRSPRWESRLLTFRRNVSQHETSDTQGFVERFDQTWARRTDA